MQIQTPQPGAGALVARSTAADAAVLYLRIDPEGRRIWVADLESATPFASMRDAARMALRMPSQDRAYSLPLASEIAAQMHALELGQRPRTIH